ncbi:ADP-ribosylation/Crystallin J1 [Wilcoxina mikolae CBS 423.85]|nr:ADP-ribosylation/Crystallin J1 [Wilcoxina mikolae CBS 423.85]
MSTLPLSSTSTKIRTSLLSLAICDALGGPAEFRRRGTFPLITTLLPNPTFSLPPGVFTDDTSMTLCLADSLCALSSFSEADQASRYNRWYRSGYLSATGECFDIGNATRAALEIWGAGGGLKEVAEKLDRSNKCGNGSLMRVLPVALALWRTPEKAEEAAERSSNVTHPHKMCVEACRVYVRLVVGILRAADCGRAMVKEDLLRVVMNYPWENKKLREVFGDGGFVRKREEEIRSSGYVLHTLEAALWCFFGTDTFEEGAVRAVNLGDDADTVAAVYGGLAGAWYGVDEGFWEGKVGVWRRGLVEREMVEGIAERLVALEWKGQ